MFRDLKAVVFDLDGTIAKLDVDWLGLRNELKVFFENNYKYKSDFLQLDYEIEKLGERISSKALIDAYTIVEKYEHQNIQNAEQIEGSLDLIRYLSDTNKILAIFSNNTRRTVKSVIEHLGIEDIFDIVVGKEDVKKHKPDPEGLILIRNKIKKQPYEICFIGNTDKDIEAGKRANIRTLHIDGALKIYNITKNNGT